MSRIGWIVAALCLVGGFVVGLGVQTIIGHPANWPQVVAQLTPFLALIVGLLLWFLDLRKRIDPMQQEMYRQRLETYLQLAQCASRAALAAHLDNEGADRMSIAQLIPYDSGFYQDAAQDLIRIITEKNMLIEKDVLDKITPLFEHLGFLAELKDRFEGNLSSSVDKEVKAANKAIIEATYALGDELYAKLAIPQLSARLEQLLTSMS